MSESLTLVQTAQPAAANLVQPVKAAAEIDPALHGLPVETVGQVDPLNPDRTSGFPNVLYHGTKDEDFALDDSRHHRNSSVGIGARSGAGLYAASKGVSQTFGTGVVVELVPQNANLLDLGSEQAREPLSEEFRTAYLKDAYALAAERVQAQFPDVDPATLSTIWKKFSSSEGLITKEDVRNVATKARDAGKLDTFNKGRRIANEIASQVNTARLMEGLTDVSIQELFATYDPVNGNSRVGNDIAFDISPTIDFLTSRGIDGAKTVQRFDGPQGKEPAVVFWKLDKVGDKATWERRLQKAPLDMAHTALAGAGVELAVGPDESAKPTEDRKTDVADTKAEVRKFLTTHRIDLNGTSDRFEAQAQSFVQNVRATAQNEGRPLNEQEVQHIKNIVEIVNNHRELERTSQ